MLTPIYIASLVSLVIVTILNFSLVKQLKKLTRVIIICVAIVPLFLLGMEGSFTKIFYEIVMLVIFFNVFTVSFFLLRYYHENYEE